MAKKATKETAEYVHSQLLELAQLARRSGLDVLAYLIDMAALEADTQRMPSP